MELWSGALVLSYCTMIVILRSFPIQTTLWLYNCLKFSLKFSFPWFASDQTWAHSWPRSQHCILTILFSFDRTGHDPLHSGNISLTKSIQRPLLLWVTQITDPEIRVQDKETQVNHCSQLTTDERSPGQFVPQCPLTHSALLLLDETHCLASKSPKYNYSPVTMRLGDRCRKLGTCRIKRQTKAQQNAGTKPVFLYMFAMVLPQAQIASLIQATVPASCADRVSITSCHLGKQLLHRKAKGIKGISPIFTVPRYENNIFKVTSVFGLDFCLVFVGGCVYVCSVYSVCAHSMFLSN